MEDLESLKLIQLFFFRKINLTIKYPQSFRLYV